MANVVQNNEGEWVLRDEWGIDDIRNVTDCDDIDAKLTDEDCINIMKIAADRFDANIGINWDVMHSAIETYLDAIANETPIYVKGEPLTTNGKPVWE